jgi:hypothetical protein
MGLAYRVTSHHIALSASYKPKEMTGMILLEEFLLLILLIRICVHLYWRVIYVASRIIKSS